MKTVRVIALVFGLIGIGLLLGALFWFRHEQTFLSTAQMAPGTVVDMVPSSSGETVAPAVEFVTADGQPIRFVSSTSSNPPSYHVGEKVEVLYQPTAPRSACLNSFFSLWGGPAILGGIGTISSLIGGGIFLGSALSLKKKLWLKTNGIPVEAQIKSVGLNTSLEVNGRNPFRIAAQWQDPDTSKVYIFESENLWFDPSPYIDRQMVTVLIDRNNPKRYWMDVSFLPELA